MVLPGCTAQDAGKLADRLRASIGHGPIEVAGGHIVVTSSLGVASNDTVPVLDAACLIRAADIALYRAKAGGRNRVELATAADITPKTSRETTALHT